MAPPYDPGEPLFPDSERLSIAELRVEAEEAVSPGSGGRRPDLDAARLWTSRDDGLLVRGVKPHSARKSQMVSRGIDTVSSAMRRQWFADRFGLQYVELYSGPGRLIDESSGRELAGSPIEALAVRRPFDRYVFCDYSRDCVDALRQRVGRRSDVQILQGDAKDLSHLERVAALLEPRALSVVYLDPARPRDLAWSTVEFIAQRFAYGDLIINLPVNSLMRAILGHHRGGGTGAGAAGRLLNHASPVDLLLPSADRYAAGPTIDAIRRYFDEQLIDLGFKKPARRTVDFPPGNPYYDVLLASRHDQGVRLWDRTNPEPDEPQLSLID
jgi:three-Cys-motif partner protein